MGKELGKVEETPNAVNIQESKNKVQKEPSGLA